MEHKLAIKVAFEHGLVHPEDYCPQSLAEEVFDCDLAGQMHLDDPAFSLNACDAEIQGRACRGGVYSC
ncbi:hypothetical protein [Endozoicomonas sp. ALC066]|uniref:hypothetical protein n=1 Tax=Endozoicomonas sp. ALC066 TaxID=3403078 RepID=UPI003BB48BD7